MNADRIVKKTDFAAMMSMFFFAASATMIPISLVNVSRDLSISLTDIGIINFVSTIELFIALLCSIPLSARFGKIKLIRFGLFITAAGLFAVSFSQNFWHIFFIFMIIGFGSGILEGVITPLVENLHPDDRGKKMNLVHAFWPIGVCATLIIAGELLSRDISWRIIFPGLAILLLGINLFYPTSRKLNLPKSRTDFSHTLEIFSKPKFWLLGFCLFFAAGAEGGFAFWTASYIQIQFETQPRAGGYGAAFFAVGMVLGRIITSKLAGKIELKLLLFSFTLAGFIICLLFFIIQPDLILLYIFMFIMGLAIACLWPSIQSYSSTVVNVDTTMLMIFIACFGVMGFSISSLIMGIIGDTFGLNNSFIIAPINLGLLLILLFLEGKMKGNSLKNGIEESC